jgi:hypothetical protein
MLLEWREWLLLWWMMQLMTTLVLVTWFFHLDSNSQNQIMEYQLETSRHSLAKCIQSIVAAAVIESVVVAARAILPLRFGPHTVDLVAEYQ